MPPKPEDTLPGMPMGFLGAADFRLFLGYAALGAFIGFLTGKPRNVGVGAALGCVAGGVFQFLKIVASEAHAEGGKGEIGCRR